MTVPAISQMEAYLIETLRNHGLSDEEIFRESKNKNLDFLNLNNS